MDGTNNETWNVVAHMRDGEWVYAAQRWDTETRAFRGRFFASREMAEKHARVMKLADETHSQNKNGRPS